jgi:phage shock protein A
METKIAEHIAEYESTIAQLKAQLAAYEGAVAALNRLLEDTTDDYAKQTTVPDAATG